MKQVFPQAVAKIAAIGKDMNGQDVANSLQAAAKLKDAASVREMVPALVDRLPVVAKDMKPQELCNTLLALVLLQDSVPQVRSLLRNDHFAVKVVDMFHALLPKMNDLHLRMYLPTVVWFCGRMRVQHDGLLTSAALQLSAKKCSPLGDWAILALQWSYMVLDSRKRFGDFQKTLETAVRRSGLPRSLHHPTSPAFAVQRFNLLSLLKAIESDCSLQIEKAWEFVY